MANYRFFEKILDEERYLDRLIFSEKLDTGMSIISKCKSWFPRPLTRDFVANLVEQRLIYVLLFLCRFCFYNKWVDDQDAEIAVLVEGLYNLLSSDEIPMRVFRSMSISSRDIIWDAMGALTRIFGHHNIKRILEKISICDDVQNRFRGSIFQTSKWGQRIQKFSMTSNYVRQYDPVNIALRGLGFDRTIETVARLASQYPDVPLISIGSGKGVFEYYWEEFYYKKYHSPRNFICVDPHTGFGPGTVLKAPDYATANDLPSAYKGNCIVLLNYIPFGGDYASESIETLQPTIVLIVYSNVNSEYPSEIRHLEYSKSPLLACFHPAFYSVLMRWDRIDKRVLEVYLPRIKNELGSKKDNTFWIIYYTVTTMYYSIPSIKSVLKRLMNKPLFRTMQSIENFYNYLSTKQGHRRSRR